MLNVAALQRAGSPVVSVVVSVDVATPRPCHPGLVVLASTPHPAPVGMEVASAVALVAVVVVEEEVSEVVEASAVVVIALVALAVESVIKVTETVSVDRPLLTPLQALAVDAEASEVVSAAIAVAAAVDTTVE